MNERPTPIDEDAQAGDRVDDETTILPPIGALSGAVAPVAGLAAVLTPDLDSGVGDPAMDPHDDSEEARAARIEADPPTDPSAPQR